MKPENFDSHKVFEKLNQLESRLREQELIEKIDIEKYNFFQTAAEFIKNRLNIILPILVQEEELNNLSSELNSGLSQINAFVGDNNIGHLTNATSNFISAIDRMRNFPLTLAENNFSFSKSISNFENQLIEKYRNIEKIDKRRREEIKSIENELNSKKGELRKLESLLTQKEAEIKSMNSAFQTEFNSIKTSAIQSFEQERNSFRSEINSDRKTFDLDREKFKKEIADDRDLS